MKTTNTTRKMENGFIKNKPHVDLFLADHK